MGAATDTSPSSWSGSNDGMRGGSVSTSTTRYCALAVHVTAREPLTRGRQREPPGVPSPVQAVECGPVDEPENRTELPSSMNRDWPTLLRL